MTGLSRLAFAVLLATPDAVRVAAADAPATSPAPVVAADGFTVIDSLDELRRHAGESGVRIRLKPGTYTLDRATSRDFIALTGEHSRWDLTGVRLRVDTKLFREFGTAGLYCVFSLSGNGIEFEGVTTENFGDHAGIQSKNKIFNITGSNVVLRHVDITTSGSSPWGYGSLFGISGGDIRKMNGIRIGWPAKNVQVIGCRVHMRAMGHGIFVQGAQDTLIQDCHVDGLLRPTNEILAETSGYAFARKFQTPSRDYNEGVTTGPDGRILPDEMIALSEDGVRLYDASAPDQPTGNTTIVDCTVTRMRRGFCTGLGPGKDKVVNCEARQCVATGFNVGSGDVLERCRADAKYGEALSLPYVASRGARVELEVLDSRGGLANDLVAVINGQAHRVTLRTADAAFVPSTMTIECATRRGYAHYQESSPIARELTLANETPARVKLNPGATRNQITSQGGVIER